MLSGWLQYRKSNFGLKEEKKNEQFEDAEGVVRNHKSKTIHCPKKKTKRTDNDLQSTTPSNTNPTTTGGELMFS